MNGNPNNLPVLVAAAASAASPRRWRWRGAAFASRCWSRRPRSARSAPASSSAPNAFAAFDALGVGERARGRAVYTERMVMHGRASTRRWSARIPTGEAFRARFGNPYAVIHRADVHQSLLEGAQAQPAIEVAAPRPRSQRFEQDDGRRDACSTPTAAATAASR